MRIDMTLVLLALDYESVKNCIDGYRITLTVEQARKLRDQISSHLRGANRDKAPEEK